MTDTGDDIKPIRFTISVRRGLAIVARLLGSAHDPFALVIDNQIDELSAAEARDYARALAWIRQNSEEVSR